MFFRSIQITDYVPLEQKASIKKFTASFTSPVVIFIGDNGSGKSSIFNALTPYGQNKSLFHKSGSVELVINHEEADYELGVIYKDKQPYYFEKDGFSINESGNVTDQQSITENIFGYSSELDKLLRMNYRMSKMTKKERKEFLMFFNPYDLSMVLDIQKKLSTLLRSVKSNIKHLSQRKLVLQDKAISTEELVNVKNKVKCLEVTQENYRKAILILEEKLKEVGISKNKLYLANQDVINFNKENNTSDFFKTISDIKNLWLSNSSLYHQHHFLPGDQINGKLSRLDARINEFENEIKSKLETLEKYNTYKKLDLEKEVTPRKERLIAIEKELIGIEVPCSIPDLSEDDIGELISETLPAIRVVLDNLISIGKRILNPKQLRSLQDTNNRLSYKLKSLLNSYEEGISLSESIDISLQAKETFPMECKIPSCSLRSNIEQKVQSLKLQQKANNLSLDALKIRIAKLQKIVDRYSSIIEEQTSVQPELDYLLDLFKSSRWLINFICSDDKLFSQLNTGISFMIIKLKNLKDDLQTLLQKKMLTKERTVLLFELSKLEDPNIPVKDLIESVTENMEKEVNKLQAKHSSMMKSIVSLTEMSTVDQTYHRLITKANDLISKKRTWVEYSLLCNQELLYTTCLNIVKEEVSNINDQLRTLSVLKQEQENIHLILNQEIIPSLEDFISKEKDYSILEQALSPANGFPKSYLLSYLNNIISNTNAILAQTWNDDITLETLTMKDDIDFTFKRRVNGHEADDIACCSSSQKDIIDIAWNLSMIITLGYGQHYPVFLDECDEHFDEGHRERLIGLISNLIKTNQLKQIFLINHHAALSSGLVDSQTICLSSNNISVPDNYNEQVMISYK